MITHDFINKIDRKDYIAEDDAPVAVTADIAPVQKKVGKIMKRKPLMKDKNENFSTIEIKDGKLSVNEFEAYKYTNNTLLVPLDESEVEYKLLNFDDHGRVFENSVLVDRKQKKIYIEANSKETINYLLVEKHRANGYNMRLPEMKHISNACRSLVAGYDYAIFHDDTEYGIRF
jgi:hypothetical protein